VAFTPEILVKRMQRHRTSVFAEMSLRAREVNAINLGQGFPDVDGPDVLKEAAIRAIEEGRGNQYPAPHGIPELRQAIAAHQKRFYGIDVDWQTEVVVATGASEALQAAFLALVDIDDEVLIFEPWFDIYEIGVELARGKVVGVPSSADSLRPNFDALRARITNKSKVVVLNTPHNPSGIVWTREELQQLADIAIEHNLIVISDEAYEHLVYDGVEHVAIASLDGMFERTVTIGSAGKSFSFTGWKVGWASGPASLISAVRVVRQHLSYVSSGPFQYAIAEGLHFPDQHWREFTGEMQAKRDLLTSGLRTLGFGIVPSQGTYFLTTDVRPLGFSSGVDFVEKSLMQAGVVAIPHSRLCQNPEVGTPFVRWAYCKKEDVLRAALANLEKLFD
jgi:N-succinyldiaminopimelate aminotransferase